MSTPGAAGSNPREILRQFDHDALEVLQPDVVNFALKFIQMISVNNSMPREEKDVLMGQILRRNQRLTISIRNLIATHLANV